MTRRTLAVVVLAAGEGTRMRSDLPKVLHPICGRPMLAHVLAVAGELEAASVALVLAPDTLERVRAALSGSGGPYQYAAQAERLGTGHALLQVRSLLAGMVDDVLVLFGDTPLLRLATVAGVVERHRQSGALVSLMSFRPASPAGYGRVVRDQHGHVAALVEDRDATPEQRAIGEVNSGIMCFVAGWLWPALDRLRPSPAKGEYYMTDLVALAVGDRGAGAATAIPAEDEREAWGVNDRVQLAQAEAVMQARILEELMRAGVTITDPRHTYVDVGVTVGRDTILWPGTLLRGATRIGAGCSIGPHASVIDAIVGDRAVIRHSVVERRSIPAGAAIGPFDYVTDTPQAAESA